MTKGHRCELAALVVMATTLLPAQAEEDFAAGEPPILAEAVVDRDKELSKELLLPEGLIPPPPAIVSASAKEDDSTDEPEADEEDANADEEVEIIEPTSRRNFHQGIGPRIGIAHDTGPGIGYRQSFTSFESFIPLLETPGHNITFFDGNLLLSNSAALGTNLGVGHRFLSERLNRIFGAYGYYDNRDTGQRTFSQFGIGFEALGEIWDFRTNVYVPVGSTRKTVGALHDPYFQGNSVFFLQEMQTALTGLDMEAGALLWSYRTFELRGFAGWYHYQGDETPHAYGARGRMAARVTRNVDLQLAVENDKLFDTTIVFQAAYRLYKRSSARSKRTLKFADRLGDPVQRQRAIAVYRDQLPVIATDEEDGTPLVFFHVDNTSAGGGGTFEDPFATLAEAEAASDVGDYIFVRRGDGTSRGMDQGITLKDNQHLLGEGTSHLINSSFGLFTLPGDTSGPAPVITAPDVAITLANANEVAGLTIDGAGGTAIYGANIVNTAIRDSTIQNAGRDAIRIENLTGGAIISDTAIVNPGRSGTGGRGIVVDSGTDELVLHLFDNTIEGTTDSAFVVNSADSGRLSLTISGNAIDSSSMLTSAPSVDIRGRGTSEVDVFFNNNVVIDSPGHALAATASDSTTFQLGMQNNAIATAGGSGVVVEANNDSRTVIDFVNNTILDSVDAGIQLNAADTAQISGQMSLLVVDGAQSDAVAINGSDESVLLLSVFSNVFQNNAGAGTRIVMADASIAGVEWGVNIVDNNSTGVVVATHDSSNLSLRLTQSNIANNAAEGVSLLAYDQSELKAIVDDVLLTTNNQTSGAAGFLARSEGASDLALHLLGNASDTGFLLESAGGSFSVVDEFLDTNEGSIQQSGPIISVTEEDFFGVELD